MSKNEKRNNRYPILDELRGLSVISMVLYHGLWDLVYMYGIKADWYKGTPGQIWQIIGCCGFIFLSGFCWQLGRKPWKRGLMVFAGGLLITMVTLLVIPSAKVICGILTFLGSAMLFLVPLSKLLEKIPAIFGAIGSFLLFLVTYPVHDGFLGFGNFQLLKLPESWYSNLFSTYLGFPEKGFWSTDYFSIFPWIFLYITGYFAYTILKEKGWLSRAKISICPPLSFVGRHSLLIYMLHQPVLYGICMIVFGY